MNDSKGTKTVRELYESYLGAISGAWKQRVHLVFPALLQVVYAARNHACTPEAGYCDLCVALTRLDMLS